MTWLMDFFLNPFLLTAVTAWFIAQLIKVIINLILQKKFLWERMVGDGGMPSGHSATVAALATITALIRSAASWEFAMAAVFAIVVCHDATGVRQETGKQAMVLNELIQILESKDLPEVKLKELVGHTPLQVLVGILLGITTALCMYHLFFI